MDYRECPYREGVAVGDDGVDYCKLNECLCRASLGEQCDELDEEGLKEPMTLRSDMHDLFAEPMAERKE